MRPLVEPADALLAVDIGNTRIGLGIWDGDGLHDSQRVAGVDIEALRPAVTTAWNALQGARRAIVIGSVHPRRTTLVQDLLEEVSGQEVLRVRDDLPLPLPLDLDHAEEVGVDRVCSAAAAFERLGGPCAIASFGTALTVDCVSSDGRFLGGTILPGFQLCLDALHENTAQLPSVAVAKPGQVFGKNTHDAMQSGVMYGLVGALREIVERFATELREWPRLVVTGGNAPIVAEMAEFVDAVVPDLCLMGIALTHRRAAGQA